MYKKIYDALHGFIRLNDIEQGVIDSEPFQRLRHLHQLGIAFLVYPGATHTRFEHSLGALQVTSCIYDHLFSQKEHAFDVPYWRQIVRCAALCHDMGHLPFSHDAEESILGRGGHEKWTQRFIKSDKLRAVWEKLEAQFPGCDVCEDVQKVAVGKRHFPDLSPWEELFSHILCGDFFGGDRIDYLLRDAKCTGVSHGLFDYDQLIEMLCVIEKEPVALGVQEDGIESCEALLLARYFMHQRVYQYSSVKAYRFHLKRFMEAYYAKGEYLQSVSAYLELSDLEILAALRLAARDPGAPGHLDARCIFNRKQRFHAIKLGREVQEGELDALRHKLGIAPEYMGWKLLPPAPEVMGLNVPVRTRTGDVVSAAHYSRVQVPLEKPNWVYVAPECVPIVQPWLS